MALTFWFVNLAWSWIVIELLRGLSSSFFVDCRCEGFAAHSLGLWGVVTIDLIRL
ncbi:hypothetical protein M758_8G080400 [Ceratodon purpureus]|nr:hypothetical protein M758_8G080400 [Ceratodon purpureus]